MPKDIEIEDKVDTGFDRGVDYADMKNKLIDKYTLMTNELIQLDPEAKDHDSKKRILNNKIIYLIRILISFKSFKCLIINIHHHLLSCQACAITCRYELV